MALKAVILGHPKARWLTAAAYSRWHMYQGKPQKYGTNYVTDSVRHRLWDVDPSTTDTERAEWDVPWWLKEALVGWEMLNTTNKIVS